MDIILCHFDFCNEKHELKLQNKDQKKKKKQLPPPLFPWLTQIFHTTKTTTATTTMKTTDATTASSSNQNYYISNYYKAGRLLLLFEDVVKAGGGGGEGREAKKLFPPSITRTPSWGLLICRLRCKPENAAGEDDYQGLSRNPLINLCRSPHQQLNDEWMNKELGWPRRRRRPVLNDHHTLQWR